jgi:hypothetical protein
MAWGLLRATAQLGLRGVVPTPVGTDDEATPRLKAQTLDNRRTSELPFDSQVIPVARPVVRGLLRATAQLGLRGVVPTPVGTDDEATPYL